MNKNQKSTASPFHPLFQQLQVDLALQVDQGNPGVPALHLVLFLQLVPFKDNADRW